MTLPYNAFRQYAKRSLTWKKLRISEAIIDSEISIKKGIAISCKIVYSKREQSKRQRVKCHRDGEFARRTKEIFPRCCHCTRCCIWETLLYVATILGRANGRLYIAAPFLPVRNL